MEVYNFEVSEWHTYFKRSKAVCLDGAGKIIAEYIDTLASMLY